MIWPRSYLRISMFSTIASFVIPDCSIAPPIEHVVHTKIPE